MPPMRAAAFIWGPGPETPMWPTSWCGMPPAVVPGWLGLCAMPGAMGWPCGAPGCCCIAGCGEKPGPMLAIISRAADYPPGGRRPAMLGVIACEVGDERAVLSNGDWPWVGVRRQRRRQRRRRWLMREAAEARSRVGQGSSRGGEGLRVAAERATAAAERASSVLSAAGGVDGRVCVLGRWSWRRCWRGGGGAAGLSRVCVERASEWPGRGWWLVGATPPKRQSE